MSNIASSLGQAALTLVNPVIGSIVSMFASSFGLDSTDSETRLKLAEIELKANELMVRAAESQNQVNAVEAASDDPYVRRWRPTAAYICVISLGVGAFSQIVLPMILIVVGLFGYVKTPEVNLALKQLAALPIEPYVAMLGGMLGLAGLRTYDKIKGVTK